MQEAIYKAGVDAYKEPRQPGDVDLVEFVYQSLCESGLSKQANAFFLTHELIQQATNKRPYVQRILLNQFWNSQLLTVASQTIEVRTYLIQDGSFEDWKKFFSRNVIPHLIHHGLPVGF